MKSYVFDLNLRGGQTLHLFIYLLLDFAKRKIYCFRRVSIYVCMYVCMYLSVRACVRTFTVLQ